MPNAAFIADFDQFNAAVAGADAKLLKFKDSSDKTETSMKSMSGGADLAKDSYQKFDGVLASVGIHIGPQIKALTDLGEAAGKTATQFGALGTAGLVLGAAIAGWQLGKAIDGVTGLSKSIGDQVAAWLGWGNVVEEETNAKMDALYLASDRAGRSITNMSDAIRINLDWSIKHNKEAKEAETALKNWRDAMDELNSAGVGWHGTLKTIDGEVVEAIKFYLDAGVSQSTLATAYNLTATQVKAVATSMAEAKKQVELLDEVQQAMWKRNLDLMKQVQAELDKTSAVYLKQTNEAVLAEFDAQTKLNKAIGLDAAGAYQVQGSAIDAYNLKLADLHAKKVEGFDQSAQEELLLKELGDALLAEARATDQVAVSTKKSNDELRQTAPAANAAADAFSKLAGDVLVSASAFDAATEQVNAMVEAAYRAAGFVQLGPIGGLRPRATGGPVTAGEGYVVGERGPEVFIPQVSGTILPSVGGAGIVVNNVFNIVDTEAGIARRVSESLTRSIMNGRKLSS